MRARLACLLVALASVLAVACDGGDEANEVAATPTPSPTQVPRARHAVRAHDFEFKPAAFEAPVGEPVLFDFTNVGNQPHTFTLYADRAYTQRLGEAGGEGIGTDQVVVTFPSPGRYYFRCEFHPDQMRGTIEAAER